MRKYLIFRVVLAMLTISIVPATFASLQDIWDGRLAYYPCEAAAPAGTVYDEAFYTNNLKLNGQVTTATSKVGSGSCSTTGRSESETWGPEDYTNITYGPSVVSFEGWYYMNGDEEFNSGWIGLANFADISSYEFVFYDPEDEGLGGYYRFADEGFFWGWRNFNDEEAGYLYTNNYFGQAQYGPLAPLYPNAWNHFVFTEDGSNVYIYLNGVLGSTTPINANVKRNLMNSVIIAGGPGVAQFLNGYIDNFLFSTETYSAQDVTDAYNSGAGFDYSVLPSCTPDWTCSDYGACNESDLAPCIAATDSNSCGESYTGDYSEFAAEVCDYCQPNWTCTGYEACVSPAPTVSCDTVEDDNECGESYTGDYTEFTNQTCTYSYGGGSGSGEYFTYTPLSRESDADTTEEDSSMKIRALSEDEKKIAAVAIVAVAAYLVMGGAKGAASASARRLSRRKRR